MARMQAVRGAFPRESSSYQLGGERRLDVAADGFGHRDRDGDGHPGESADEKGSLACAPEAEWLVACIRWIRRAVEREHTRVLSAPPPTTE